MFWIIQSAISQGILWGIMALGVYITFRVLNFADLTVDGSFALGGALSAVLVYHGVPPLLAVLAATIGGLAAGFCTGFLNTKLRIPGLLASILTQIALYSINLRIMGSPNLSLLRIDTLFTKLAAAGFPDRWVTMALAIVCSLIVILLMYWLFGTEIGSAIRATGNNPKMIRALGVHTDTTTILGLVFGNGLVALSGGLIAQQQGYGDIGMGTGAIVIGLAAIIIGEVLFPQTNFMLRLTGVIVGAVVYRIVIALVLKMGLRSTDMKLFTAILVALALYLPTLRGHARQFQLRRRNGHA
ncbi:MAG: ABC transporter permease [Clostridia bacterium]|nr:ABC transporter permease [Eubacteriales bacterium]MDD3867027.1 ABC transporter permease [Eubacteriales bacterium]MDD4462394.1 ABC transporter permease [Eubacteriales bacterium]NCC47638.1 ABC transporter permease [Clostridia bacterium]